MLSGNETATYRLKKRNAKTHRWIARVNGPFAITEDHVVFGNPQAAVDPVSGDLLGAFLHQGPETIFTI